MYVYATWEQLEPLTATKLPLTEIRTPAFILDTIEDLSDAEQTEYVIDLAGRVDPAPPEAPAVCHLDTGVFRGHQLISGSLASSDQHTIVDPYGNDRNGHETHDALYAARPRRPVADLVGNGGDTNARLEEIIEESHSILTFFDKIA